MPVLAAAIAAAIPALAYLAEAIAASAILVGAGVLLTAALEEISRGNYIDRIRALFNLRGLISNIMSQPLVQEVLTRQGAEAALLAQSAAVAITATATSQLPLLTFPYEASLQELELWYQGEAALWSLGVSSQERIDIARSFYVTQYATLTAALPTAPAAPVQAVTPLTQVAVPGFGTVGVTVRVAGQLITGAAQPAAPAAPATAFSPVINVAAPNVMVAAPNVMVQAAPAPNVFVQAPAIETAAMTAAIAGSLALIGTQVATGLAANAGPNAHAAQQARYGCQSGFLGGLMGVVGTIGPQLAAGVVLGTDNPIRRALEALVSQVITAELALDRLVIPNTYEDAVANASTRLTQAVGFGLQAQAIAFTAEAMTPLKQMGFAQIAGFMGELAGFGRMAQGLMGTVENAAVVRPLQYQANLRFRPVVPGAGEISRLFERYEIPAQGDRTAPGFRDSMALQGLPDYWISALEEELGSHPGVLQAVRLSAAYPIRKVPGYASPPDSARAWLTRAGFSGDLVDGPDWYFTWVAAKGGMDPVDLPLVVQVARRAQARVERSAYLGVVSTLVRDGFLGLDAARKELEAAYEFTDPWEARLKVWERQRDQKLLSDTRAVVIMSMSRGLITRGEARDQLGQLGMDGQRAELEVLKGTLGMLPGMKISISAPEEVLEEPVGEEV